MSRRLLLGMAALALLGAACSNTDFAALAKETKVEAAEGPASGSEPTGSDNKPVCDGPATARPKSGVEPLADPPEPQLPVTYTDSTGKEVKITDADRVLALDSYGTLATTVYALGLGDRLIGRDISTGIPELADLPLVTQNGHELNGEAILNLRPSLILTDYSIGPLEVQLQLIDSGIPVVILSDKRSRAEIGPQIKAVAEALGVSEAGEELASKVEADVQEAEERVKSLAPADQGDKLRMAFMYLRGNAGVYSWLGKGSGADELIEALGGIDVATEVGVADSAPVNAEGLVKANPDMFLMMTKGLESTGGVEGLGERPGIADTKAGQTRCVVDMSDYQILSFGPQFPDVLDALTTAVYEEAAGQ